MLIQLTLTSDQWHLYTVRATTFCNSVTLISTF